MRVEEHDGHSAVGRYHVPQNVFLSFSSISNDPDFDISEILTFDVARIRLNHCYVNSDPLPQVFIISQFGSLTNVLWSFPMWLLYII